MKILYMPKKFGSEALALIDTANSIIGEYQDSGFSLTLRQLYYQFVARDLLPNTQQSYKRIGDVVNDGRLAGMIDWGAIEDRTRNLRRLPDWRSAGSIIGACAAQFRLDRWADQPVRPEVWIEKDALVGVIEGVCHELHVPHFSCRGYTSQSEMWVAARRMLSPRQRHLIIHLGDHDPSGIDMTRDISDRLALFGAEVEVRRIALNWAQVEEYAPPPNPAKITDSRAEKYIEKFGPESWELDALDPTMLETLVRDELESETDDVTWEETLERERGIKDRLLSLAEEEG
jgi:hypothetical protein